MAIVYFSNCFAVTEYAIDKSDKIKPRWLHVLPQSSNGTFDFVKEIGDSKTIEDARSECQKSLLRDAGFASGMTVKTNIVSKDEEHINYQNDNKNYSLQSDFVVEDSVSGKEVELHAIKLDEYWERHPDGLYHLTTLYARSQPNQTPVFDDVKITTKYGIDDMWRSLIVPGWGQLYKGSTVKGVSIMGGTVLCIGAIVFTDCMRSSYASKISKTHSATLKLSYDNKRSNYATARNICIGALGALYVYNVVDALVSPGARRILTSPAGANKFSYQWAPTVTDDAGIGVVAQFTF